MQIRPDADGMASLWGALTGVGGRALEHRLRQLSIGVCGSDPRTLAQRRADAMTALALGADRLACACADPGCPCAPQPPAAGKPRVLIQVMIDAATLAGAAELPGVLAGFGLVDPELVRELAADATWQRLLTDAAGTVTGVGPALSAGAVPEGRTQPWRYTPGAALTRLVRARDAHCRFPGCGTPTRDCDLDHVVAFHHANPAAWGATTAENLQCLCRCNKTRGLPLLRMAAMPTTATTTRSYASAITKLLREGPDHDSTPVERAAWRQRRRRDEHGRGLRSRLHSRRPGSGRRWTCSPACRSSSGANRTRR